MPRLKMLLLATSLLSGMAQAASDKPVMAPPPDWVKPVSLPPATASDDGANEAPVRLLLSDQQVKFEPGKETSYSDVALKIQTPQGLAAGNLSFPWNPETDTLTVHKLIIHRGDKDIDVLGSGQTFTVVRREPNLESAMLDGVLTANIQPEGLQVGDVLEFAMTMTSSDPVLKGHVEQAVGGWNLLPIARAHLRVQWPSSMAVNLRQTDALPPIKPIKSGGTSTIELSLDNVEPIIPPKHAPARYSIGRIVELSDFKSWGDLGALLAPLYAEKAKVPAQGPLRDELEKIKAASSDPKVRAEAALKLVQDRVRYVALLMGAGGLVPASAEETWSRRFGDCKAKSALLLALLHELGIEAVPVTANIAGSDGLDARLPMIGLFNHVLVRATIAGKNYWLDGTRTGDTDLDRLKVPDFGWGLPLLSSGARPVRMLPAPLDRPDNEMSIHIDARAGLTEPAPMKAETILRGDGAVGAKLGLARMTTDARDRALRDYWKGQFSFIDVNSASASFDEKTGEEHITMEGVAHMEWKDGWYQTDKTGLGYDADFSRDKGPNQDAPFAVNYPGYSRTVETIQVPPGFPESKELPNAKVDEIIGGTEYHRHAQLIDNVFTIEASVRTIAPEFPAKDAPAAQKALRALADKTAYLKRPANYRVTAAELKSQMTETPKTAQAFVNRGNTLLENSRFADALKDFDSALKLDPRNVLALADRAIAHIWLRDLGAATKDLDAATAIDPNNKIVFHGRGMIAEAKGDVKGAIEAFSRAIAIDPSDGFALSHRAGNERAAGDAAAALADAAAALKLDPKQSDLHMLRASILRSQNKIEEGMAEGRAVTDADPDNAYAYVQAAQIYRIMGDTDAVMKAFGRALELKPAAALYVGRANFRPRTDLAGREADIDTALKTEPDNGFALAAKAGVQIDKADYAGAVATYTTALAKQPKDATMLNGRGIAYAKAGKEADAKADFESAREQATGEGLLNNICWSKATYGVALETALSECDAALSKAPEAAAIMDSQAFVLLRLGRLDEAIAVYDKALAKAGDFSSSLFGRAVAWSRKGDKAKAKADLDAALKLDPTVQDQFAGYGVTIQP